VSKITKNAVTEFLYSCTSTAALLIRFLLLTRSALYGFLFWHLYMLIKKKNHRSVTSLLCKRNANEIRCSLPIVGKILWNFRTVRKLNNAKTNERRDSTFLGYKTIIREIWWVFVIKNSPKQRNTGNKNYVTLLTKRLSDEINKATRKIIATLKLPPIIILSRSCVFWKK